MNNIKRTGDTSRNILLVIITMILVFAALKACAKIAIPIVVSTFVFFIIYPLLDRLDRVGVPHVLSTIVCFVIIIAILATVWYLVSRIVYMLIKQIPAYATRIAELDRQATEFLSRYVKLPEGVTLLSRASVSWSSLAVNSLTTISGRLIEVIKLDVLVLLYVLFLMLEKEVFLPKLLAAFPGPAGHMSTVLAQRISYQVSKYLLLKAAISFATGACFYLVAKLVGLDIPLMYGFLAFALNFIPSIGSIIVTVFIIFMAIVQLMPAWSPIIFVAICAFAIQMILGNILDPKLQGGQLNLSPFFILVSLAIWGYIWGVVGMFIAVPLTSCIEIVCANIDSLKPVAIIMSGGKGYVRQYKPRKHKHKPENASSDSMDHGDIILPDNFGS